MNKELDAYTMLLANKEAQTKGEKLPYTKQQFNETNEGNTSSLIFDWNLSLPTAEQFTKLEHSEGRHCNAIAMAHWNIDLPHAEPYTKQEHAAAEGCDKFEMQEWNEFLPDAEPYTEAEINKLQVSNYYTTNKITLTIDEIWRVNMEASNNGKKLPYTKKEHSETEGCTAETMRFWNECLPEAEPYTKEEHASAEGCTAEAKSLWNLVVSKSEQYTKMEMITNKTVTK